MRVLLVGNLNVIHTARWANGLLRHGIDVHVASVAYRGQHRLEPEITVHELSWPRPYGYFLDAPRLRKLVQELRPDVVNAHYASGYGTLVRLAGVRPVLLSVWGSDVYDFPHVSPIHRRLVAANIRSAAAIGSTSHAMARVVRRIQAHEHVFITPFGVDERLFSPAVRDRSGDGIVIGTVKKLAPKYGIDTLLRAFALARERLLTLQPDVGRSLRLLITGEGEQEAALRSLAVDLAIADCVTFNGAVPHEAVPQKLRELDIFVALSRLDSESFGVAAVEASACGLPVVVSDADGLAEVTVNERTGLVVPKDHPGKAAEALIRLVLDPELRGRLGRAGREHVLERYTWSESVRTMAAALETTAGLAQPSWS